MNRQAPTDPTADFPALEWLREASALLDRLASTQGAAIEQASQWLSAEAIAADGLVHLFGTGDSRIPVEEMFPRYGSYPGFNPMVELSMTFHTQIVGLNGQRQAMFIERTPGSPRSSSRTSGSAAACRSAPTASPRRSPTG